MVKMEVIITRGLRCKLRERREIADISMKILDEIICDCAQIVVQCVFGKEKPLNVNVANAFIYMSHSASIEINGRKIYVSLSVMYGTVAIYYVTISLPGDTKDPNRWKPREFREPVNEAWLIITNPSKNRFLLRSISSVIKGESGVCNDMEEIAFHSRRLINALRDTIISAGNSYRN
jgi:hypothetical protein